MPPSPSQPDNPEKNGGTRPGKHKRTVDLGIATIVSAIIAAVALVGGGALGRVIVPDTNPSPEPTVTKTITPQPAAKASVAHLEFALTAGSRVPWCQVYSGTGKIPAGHVLAIFDTPAGPGGQPASQPFYSFDGKAVQPVPGHWQTEPLQIGTQGLADVNVNVTGVLTSTSFYQYMNSVRAKNGLPWISETLPPGPRIILPVVTDGHRGMACT